MKTFVNNTDTVDIRAESLGVSSFGYDNRGLSIQIRHNRDKALFQAANEMSKIITEALNQAVADGRLKLPE